MTPTSPRLLSLGTAVPPHGITQDQVLSILAQAKGHALPARMADILGNTGIDQRHIAMPPEYYFAPRSWAGRAAVYADAASAMFEAAAAQALDRYPQSAAEIARHASWQSNS